MQRNNKGGGSGRKKLENFLKTRLKIVNKEGSKKRKHEKIIKKT